MTHPPLSGLASSPSSQGFGTLQVLPAAPAHWAEGTVSPPRAATAASSSSSSLRHLQVTTPACPEPLSIQAPALARHLVSAQRSGHISLYRAYGPWQGHPTSDPCPQPRHHPNRPACTEPAACPVCCLLHRGLCRWHTILCPKAFLHGMARFRATGSCSPRCAPAGLAAVTSPHRPSWAQPQAQDQGPAARPGAMQK